MPEIAAQFMDEEFPPQLRPLLPAAMRRAYANADHAIDAIPFLQSPGGPFHRGDLIALAADYEFARLIASGALPGFDCSWEPFAKPTGVHLVMRTRNSRITISQMDDPTKRPRRAEFRNDYAAFNVRYLFEQMNRDVEDAAKTKHILLMHGYQTLSYVQLALPNRTGAGHIYRTPNLLDLPHEVAPTVLGGQDDEGPRQSPDPEAIEHLKKIVADNDDR